MFFNKSFPYSTSFRDHLLIATILSFLVVFILIFLQPFGAGNFNNPYKNLYFIGYGIISLIVYIALYFSSSWYYVSNKTWKWKEELVFSFLYVSLAIIIAFFYTELFINKKPEHIYLDFFVTWFRLMFFGFGIILSIVSMFVRNYYGKTNESEKEINKDSDKAVLLKSSLKKESFLVVLAKVIYVKSEDNYVNIYYEEDQKIKKKVMRNTLSSVFDQLESMIRVHRSYIINPSYISSLEGNAQNGKVRLDNIEEVIPVSKTYFDEVKSHMN
ncbi:LytTR family transcriptional regulator [Aquimarina sp. MMG015]|uniref:LytR/AlgR family response regulator transcription factor n=1 Tax=Aquimarina sp. MMG015 TaxID=2822689 RepID=UPI001B3A036F|nr:LytTR family DNA-binding domain-containing protein [Aquimarina sp. MMG015]MBQ4801699.1 LytTR family transcriptional regulator [Aquimarina sp. MMG015]